MVAMGEHRSALHRHRSDNTRKEMNKFVDPSWVPITDDEFKVLLKHLNYVRDGWADGVLYLFARDRVPFAFSYDNGRIVVDPQIVAPA